MKAIWLALMCITLLFSSLAAPFSKEKQYTKLKNPVKMESQVLEFFSFYCQHCYNFEQLFHISGIAKKVLPAGTKVVKYHVDFLGKMGRQLTQAWAVAMALGIEEKISPLLFEGLQKTKTIRTPEDIRIVFIKSGITAEEYDSTWNSFFVKSLLIQQRKAANDLKVCGVPATFINGKYMVKNDGLDSSSTGAYFKQFTDLIIFLLSRK